MSHKLFRSFFVLVFVIGLVAIQAPQSVRAAGPWYVSTTGDNSNDCLSLTTPCATINGAIGKASGEDTIYVAEGIYTGTGDEVVLIDIDITLSGGWDSTFTTQGGMSTIDGQGARRGITSVFSGIPTTVILERFIVQNGYSDGPGGGILSVNKMLIVANSVVSMNVADAGQGGGISSEGGDLVINDSIINQNHAYRGGGIYKDYGNLTINNSIIRNNVADGLNTSLTDGGGIYYSGEDFPYIITINRSSITNNIATASVDAAVGGGIRFYREIDLFINNSTISGNASVGSGGGISGTNYSSREITIQNSTITNNTASLWVSYGISRGGGIALNQFTGVVTLRNSILAKNNASSGPDCIGFIDDSDHNIIGDTNGCLLSMSVGDLINTDPVLGVLSTDGYHPLLIGSPAIDAGNSSTCLPTDQRGVARPQGAACDIGAFELEVANPIIEVSIDIKAGSEVNPINTKSKGKIPVAILSTADFDAPSMVDKTSLTFGETGDETSLAFCNKGTEDVNDDGLQDLICHFYNRGTGFQKGDTEGILKGQTMDGIPIEGNDTVKILK